MCTLLGKKRKMKEVSAGAIVFYLKNNDIFYLLLYKKASDHYREIYEFPKGGVEHAENFEQTAIREVEEETGLKINLLPGFKEKLTWFYKRNGATIYKEAIFFIGQAKSQDVKVSKEHDSFVWLRFEETIKKLRFKNQREMFKKAHEFVKNYIKQKKLHFV